MTSPTTTASPFHRHRSALLSIGIFAIVATGAVMGAKLKAEREHKTVVTERYEENVDERIERLLENRARLTTKRNDILLKISGIESRIKAKKDGPPSS